MALVIDMNNTRKIDTTITLPDEVADFCQHEADILEMAQNKYFSKLISTVVLLNMGKHEVKPPMVMKKLYEEVLGK